MRIGIITYHYCQNIGAVLQNVALTKYLNERGYQVFTIDYFPDYARDDWAIKLDPINTALKAMRKATSEKRIKRVLVKCYVFTRRYIGAIRFNTRYRFRKRRDENHQRFIRRHIQLTRHYDTFLQLMEAPPDMDIYIVGSDQMWNYALTNKQANPAYFLQFAPVDARKVAYSISMTDDLLHERDERLNELTSNLDAISLREDTFCRQLQSRLEREIPVVVDPTLLIEREQYDAMMTRVDMNEPYIFAYVMYHDEVIKEALIRAEQDFHMKVVLCDYAKNDNKKLLQNYVDCSSIGPDEFLGYLSKASYVITNSFHGTALCVVYHKNFFTALGAKADYRMRSLLNRLGLMERAITSEEMPTAWNDPVDYTKTDHLLTDWRKQSMGFLMSAIGQTDI